ncbi:MAG: hypothetical protein IPM42_02500 [Saprospiraceae bacterium]|nr:hypothetical protein [Saprospiraceae bacterium]
MTKNELYQIFEDSLREGDEIVLNEKELQKEYDGWKSEYILYSMVRKLYILRQKIAMPEREFKRNLEKISDTYFATETASPKVFGLKSIYGKLAAVSIVILTCVMGVKYYADQVLSNKAILASHQLIEQATYRSIQTKPDINTIKIAFADKNYHQVIESLKEINYKEGGKPDYILLLGASYFHLGEFEKAVEVYTFLTNDGDPYIDEGFKNIVLCQISKNDTSAALETCSKAISHPDVLDKEFFAGIKKKLNNPIRKLLK